MSGTIEKYLGKIAETTVRSGVYAYRGQEDSRWPLQSAATRRLIKYGDAELQSPEFSNSYIKYHRDALLEPARTRGFGVEQGRNVSDLQLLAKLQHLGAATGLIDFTWNPLVALWFASQDPNYHGQLFLLNTRDTLEMDLVSSDEKKQDIKTVFSQPDNSSPHLLYWEPMLGGDVTSRILRQRSLCIIGRPLIPEDGGNIEKIQIAKDDKASLLEDLALLDIDQESLFQDIYGFSAANSATSSLLQIRDLDYRLQGTEFHQKGEYQRAVKAYSKYIGSKQDVGEIYFLRGNAYAEDGKHSDAIRDYDDAIIRKDQVPHVAHMVYFNRGNSKSVLEDYEGALEDYTKAIEERQGHDDPVLHFNRANTYADLHEFEKAMDEYDKAVIGPRTYSSAHFNKGNALVALGRFDEALQCYKESALKAADTTSADQNMSQVERVIHGIRGRNYRAHFEASGVSPKAISVLRVTIVGDHSNPEGFFIPTPIMGNAGNAGNFGGRGVPGGKGLEGQLGFVVLIESDKGNQV